MLKVGRVRTRCIESLFLIKRVRHTRIACSKTLTLYSPTRANGDAQRISSMIVCSCFIAPLYTRSFVLYDRFTEPFRSFVRTRSRKSNARSSIDPNRLLRSFCVFNFAEEESFPWYHSVNLTKNGDFYSLFSMPPKLCLRGL